MDAVRQYWAMQFGQRLRAARVGLRWSLREAARQSAGRFSVSAIGFYERGDRAITVIQAHQLAELYGVDPVDLIAGADPAAPPKLVLDIPAVVALPATEQPLQSFVRQITALRGDYVSRGLSIRRSDVDVLAAMYGCTAAQVNDRLHALGVLSTHLNPY